MCKVFVSVISLCLLWTAVDGREVDTQVAIDMLRGYEDLIHTVSFEGTVRKGSRASLESPVADFAEDPNWSQKVTAAYEPRTKRHLVTVESTTEWIDGAAPYVSLRQQFSYDGSAYRWWCHTSHGTELPQPDSGPPQEAAITNSDEGAIWDDRMARVLLCMFPPFFLSEEGDAPRSLSQFLMNNLKSGVSVHVDDSPGKTSWAVDTKDGDKYVRIVTDRDKGGAVTRVTWSTSDDNDPQSVFAELDVDLQLVDGFHVPRRILRYYQYDKDVEEVVFRNVLLNKPLEPSTFVLTFPVGAYVRDFITSKAYVVSKGPVDEAKAIADCRAVQGLTVTHRLLPGCMDT